MRSSLDKHMAKSAATQDEIRKMAAAAWHQRNVLVVPLDDPTIIIDDIHRQALINVGNKIFGERKK